MHQLIRFVLTSERDGDIWRSIELVLDLWRFYLYFKLFEFNALRLELEYNAMNSAQNLFYRIVFLLL